MACGRAVAYDQVDDGGHVQSNKTISLTASQLDEKILKRLGRGNQDPELKEAMNKAFSELRSACDQAARQIAQKYGAKVLAPTGDRYSTEISVGVGMSWDHWV